MTPLEQSGLLVSLVLSVMSIGGMIALVAGKLSRMELQVGELWKFRDDLARIQMRSGASEAARSGYGQANSPFTISDESKSWLSQIAGELQAFYVSLNNPAISDVELFIQIDRTFGQRLFTEYCMPHKLTHQEGLLIAAAIAKNGSTIDMPEDRPASEARPPSGIMKLSLVLLLIAPGLVQAEPPDLLARPARITIRGDETSMNFNGAVMDGGQPVKDNPWDKEIDQPFFGDGIHSDNATFSNLRVKNIRGACVVVGRSTQPLWNSSDTPKAIGIDTVSGHDGVVVTAPDWNLLECDNVGMRDHGIDVREGNCHITGGHNYGCGTGVRIRTGAWSFLKGVQFSDCPTCLLVEAHRSSVVDCFSQRGWNWNIKVCAETHLAHNTIDTSVANADYPHPIGIEFTAAANWSSDLGSRYYVKPGAIAIVNRASNVTIKDVNIDGPTSEIGYLQDAPVDNSKVELNSDGPAIVITKAGMNNRYDIRCHTTAPRIELPSEWNDTNHCTLNGVEQKPKAKK